MVSQAVPRPMPHLAADGYHGATVSSAWRTHVSRVRLLRLVAALLLATGIAGTATADTLRCRSRDYRYAFCRTPYPVRHARVVDRKSDRPCIQGRTWGYDRNGIWVDHGCDAEFDVVYRGGGGGGPYPPYPPGGGGGGGGGWFPGDGGWGQPGGVPGWAVGTWRSDSPVAGAYSTITIYPSGSTTWVVGRSSTNGYWAGSSEIRLYNNRAIRFDRRGNRVQASLPGYGVHRFRRIY